MSKTQIGAAGEDLFEVRGSLDLATVTGLLREGERLFGNRAAVIVDLRRVTRASSAALALLLEWVDLAAKKNQRLRFTGLPRALEDIARMSNVTALLPLEPVDVGQETREAGSKGPPDGSARAPAPPA